MVRVRFAPSPTGPLHIGGVRTALFNYLFAKKNKGSLILRIEDTDQTRLVKGAEDYICESLKWCGIEFDEGINEGGDYGPYRQSDRKEIYGKYVEQLISSGNAYIAFDTPEELEAMRNESEKKGETFTYNFRNRKELTNSISLSKEEVNKRIEKGEDYVVRFKMPVPENGEYIVELNDIIRGKIKVNISELDDKILQKSDGLPTYHLANIVDDHLMKITHVIRGEEWLPSLPLHVLLYKAYDWEAPQFAHLPLILKPTGKGKLSKRDGDKMGFPVFPTHWIDEKGEEYNSFKEDGYLPEAVINFLALLGWNPGDDREFFSMEELIKEFDLNKVGKSGSRFDPEKARWFNHHYITKKSGEELAVILKKQLEIKEIEHERFNLSEICELVKDRLNLTTEIYEHCKFFFEAPETYDDKFLKKAWKNDSPDILESAIKIIENCSEFKAESIENEIKTWLEKEQIGFGKIMPALRLALVGEGKGPGVFEIIEILGKQESVNRIKNLIIKNK